ncbi:hypothetical protein RSOL_218890, partial [Rhizoctonia solani AG-3 Rhs1AP]
MPKDTNKENVSPNLRRARQKAAAWPYRVPTLGGHQQHYAYGSPCPDDLECTTHENFAQSSSGTQVKYTHSLSGEMLCDVPSWNASSIESDQRTAESDSMAISKFHPNLGLDSHFTLHLSPNSHFSIIPKFNSNLKFKATRK